MSSCLYGKYELKCSVLSLILSAICSPLLSLINLIKYIKIATSLITLQFNGFLWYTKTCYSNMKVIESNINWMLQTNKIKKKINSSVSRFVSKSIFIRLDDMSTLVRTFFEIERKRDIWFRKKTNFEKGNLNLNEFF